MMVLPLWSETAGGMPAWWQVVLACGCEGLYEGDPNDGGLVLVVGIECEAHRP